MKKVGLVAAGASVPQKILTNADLEKMVETNDEWITVRTGIKERHILEKGEKILDHIVKSSQTACESAKFDPSKLDFVINATLSPDRISPAEAFEVAKALNVSGSSFCFDLNAACSGLLYGMAVAESLLQTRDISYGLVTSGEQLTRTADYTDRNSCILFGDGAAAFLMTNDNPEHVILHSEIGADPAMAEEVHVGGIADLLENTGDYYFRQNGKGVFKFAVGKIKEMYEKVPQKAGIDPKRIKYFIPHQANMRILDCACKEMVENGTEIINNIEHFGNTSSASIGIAFAENYHRFQKGDLILMTGFGAGLSWASVLLEW